MSQPDNLPMPRPPCKRHGPMELRHPGTREQEFCGTWYRCQHCGSGTLLPSPELLAQLDEQRRATANEQLAMPRIGAVA